VQNDFMSRLLHHQPRVPAGEGDAEPRWSEPRTCLSGASGESETSCPLCSTLGWGQSLPPYCGLIMSKLTNSHRTQQRGSANGYFVSDNAPQTPRPLLPRAPSATHCRYVAKQKTRGVPYRRYIPLPGTVP